MHIVHARERESTLLPWMKGSESSVTDRFEPDTILRTQFRNMSRRDPELRGVNDIGCLCILVRNVCKRALAAVSVACVSALLAGLAAMLCAMPCYLVVAFGRMLLLHVQLYMRGGGF